MRTILQGILVGICVMAITPAWAQTLEETVENGQVDIQLAILEPSTNADGTPLNDLGACFGSVDLTGDGQAAQDWNIQANSPQGGQERLTAEIIFLLTDAQASAVTGIRATAACGDLVGNQSAVVTLVRAMHITVPPVTAPPAPDTMPPGSPTIRIHIEIVITP